MLRLHDDQPALWEQMLTDQIQLMGPEIEAIDRLLDDPRFRAPSPIWSDMNEGCVLVQRVFRTPYDKELPTQDTSYFPLKNV